MSKIITIRAGTFQADITAAGFIGLRMRRIQKLARLMASEPWENRETVDVMREAFQDHIDDAKKKWEDAQLAYRSEYISPRFSNLKADKIERHNQKLLDDVKKAKRAYDILIKKKETFEKEIT